MLKLTLSGFWLSDVSVLRGVIYLLLFMMVRVTRNGGVVPGFLLLLLQYYITLEQV